MGLSHNFWSHSHIRKSLKFEGTWTDSFGSNHLWSSVNNLAFLLFVHIQWMMWTRKENKCAKKIPSPPVVRVNETESVRKEDICQYQQGGYYLCICCLLRKSLLRTIVVRSRIVEGCICTTQIFIRLTFSFPRSLQPPYMNSMPPLRRSNWTAFSFIRTGRYSSDNTTVKQLPSW